MSTARNKADVAWAAAAVLGLAVWLGCVLLGNAACAWQALFVNFIFFTPLAAAMVVWPAAVMLSRGQWMGPVKPDALSGLFFAPVSLLAFVGLWFSRVHWAVWLRVQGLPNQVWLSERFLFTRDGLALLIWWLVAFGFGRKARSGTPKFLAGVAALVYALVFSLLAFDMVMALEPRWVSSLFGGYFFVTGMYAAIAALAVAASFRQGEDPDRLQDLGKLVVVFSIMSAYLLFSQLLPIWYENLPYETLFAVPRMNVFPWAGVSIVLLGVVYLGPLLLLLTVRAKRSSRYLGAVSLLVLAGLWIERWWLVGPALGLGPTVGVADVSLCVGLAGVLGWGVCRNRKP